MDREVQWRPGFHHSDQCVFRIWWLWFAIAVYPTTEFELITKRQDWHLPSGRWLT
jgi:hypothetical protein